MRDADGNLICNRVDYHPDFATLVTRKLDETMPLDVPN